MTKTESALSELPLDLIDTIAQYTPICDLLYLCQTNRRMNGVCLRWIYWTVAIHSPARLVVFCKMLISNIVRAKYVRTLLIHCYPQYILNVFYHLFRAALRNMESIESLEVSGSPELFSLFSGIHFPRLRDCSIPFSINIVSFLQRHPKLSGLSLDPVPHDSVIDLSTLPPIHMPELQSFSGPEIVTLSRPDFWDPRLMTNFLRAFETVEKSTIPVRELQNILLSWDTSLLSTVATCIPGLTSLSIRNISSIHAPLEMEVSGLLSAYHGHSPCINRRASCCCQYFRVCSPTVSTQTTSPGSSRRSTIGASTCQRSWPVFSQVQHTGCASAPTCGTRVATAKVWRTCSPDSGNRPPPESRTRAFDSTGLSPLLLRGQRCRRSTLRCWRSSAGRRWSARSRRRLRKRGSSPNLNLRRSRRGL
ncbi:hypothetical protein B0H10DRAFT_2084770 [Mycena sp. CBHHK59/15]|nr:hypothetical protein B0H10DRAFT_2084770 [Mycena sp. CBHHK59/15]